MPVGQVRPHHGRLGMMRRSWETMRGTIAMPGLWEVCVYGVLFKDDGCRMDKLSYVQGRISVRINCPFLRIIFASILTLFFLFRDFMPCAQPIRAVSFSEAPVSAPARPAPQGGRDCAPASGPGACHLSAGRGKSLNDRT